MLDDLKFHESSERLATEKDIRQFEKEFGLTLPTAFVDFCYQYNGGYAVKARYLVPPKFVAFHKEYPHNRGLIADFLFGLNSTLEQVRATSAKHLFENQNAVRLLPISEDFLGNFAVVRCDAPEGSVLWLDHEIWNAPGELQLLRLFF